MLNAQSLLRRFVKRYCVACFILIVLWLAGCSLQPIKDAPVVNAWSQSSAASSDYKVRRGDTLYSIAWAFGLDYRALAEANHLPSPYSISPGQRLTMNVSSQPAASTPVSAGPQGASLAVKHPLEKSVYVGPVASWRWPARGSIVNGFSNQLAGNKGINIRGRLGEAVYASASGDVVYAGAGVRGYGNLIIIKHNASYLSAYAYNQAMLVKEGQRVSQGQVIARMGQTTGGKVMLHFEIRRDGKPVNPLHYLAKAS